MAALRTWLMIRRGWFALLVAFTLFARLIVPAGFMPVVGGGRASLQICSGMASSPTRMAMPMAGMHHGGGEHDKPVKSEMPCAFAGPGLAALGSAPLVLLAAAIVFAFLLAVRSVARLHPGKPARLRPPLRAPPLIA